MFKKIIFFVLISTFLTASDWVDALNQKTESLNRALLITEDPQKGLILDHLAADTAIAAWGFKYWHWGERSFHFQREKWFGADNPTGGSDKTGHFYMTYLLSRILSSRMEDRGVECDDATLKGTLSAALTMTLLEVGDGTSKYGFSKEDLISDYIGAVSGYLLRSNPKTDDLFDIRLEYLPTSSYLRNGDAATDYSGMKHLIALKLSGFETFKNTPLRYIEIQTGYYARGYRSFDKDIAKSQQVYVGIGLDITQLAKESRIHMLENLFEFYQPGHTYVESKLWQRP